MIRRSKKSVRTARALLDLGHATEAVLQFLPEVDRAVVRKQIESERNFILVPVKTISAAGDRPDWLGNIDRANWYYWPTLRQYLITRMGLPSHALRSLEDSSDRVLRQLANPQDDKFDVRGLVLGFVQSGKTANYTAVIAKAADAGYRLFIILAGIDNGLRRQTNIRLKKELVGYTDGRTVSVPLPPIGKQWHEFTRADLNGDFQPGFANHAALQGSQPVLLVVKKNGDVLRRLLAWLDDAPIEVRQRLPVLIIDDEADQASIDTRGSYQNEQEYNEERDAQEYDPPSIINGLIRELLLRFEKRSYIAYTATPYANIIIPHNSMDPDRGNDLYPKDFIIDLPKPDGYFGAEELFGLSDSEDDAEGLDVIREVDHPHDIDVLQSGGLPDSLKIAMMDFVLAGAARASRGHGNFPATMLVHTSHAVATQSHLRNLISTRFGEIRDEWRYQRRYSISKLLKERWESEFRPVTQKLNMELDAEFSVIEPNIGPFFESVQVVELNSSTGEVLDYEQEPHLKAIAIGGNKLSRGLTLEGLLVSYFVRRSPTYDTLMQMARWFGFRGRYEDLCRIWTTLELAEWFSDLALVEHRLRSDIQIYEAHGLTPYEVGMRIWQHPTLQVTSPLKRRFASTTTVSQTYSLSLEQTFRFPLNEPELLAEEAERMGVALGDLVERLGKPSEVENKGPRWEGVTPDVIIDFLSRYDGRAAINRGMSIPLVCKYIDRMNGCGELASWTISFRAREDKEETLGLTRWSFLVPALPMISRTRLRMTDSLGVVTTPGDEEVGLNGEEIKAARAIVEAAMANNQVKSRNSAAREVRSPRRGLLLLYPISRFSGHEKEPRGIRKPLFQNPRGSLARDLLALAVSLPRSEQPQQVEAYLTGSARWQPVE